MRVLVTGATGFIGRHLRRRLVDKLGHQVAATARYIVHDKDGHYFKLDLTNESKVRSMMQQVKPEIVFHLAGNPIIKLNECNQTDITKDNVESTHNLLAHCPKDCRFVLASSAAVYGDCPIDMTETMPLRPTSVYGATKVAAEALVDAYTRLGKVQGVSLRLVANVGAGATHGVLGDLIRKAKSDAPTLELIGEAPGSRKHYVHVSDTVDAFMHFGLQFTRTLGPLNIANEYTLDISRMATLVLEGLKIQKPVSWTGSSWNGDNRLVQISSGNAAYHGWKAKLSSYQAVIQAIKDIEGS